MPSSLTRVLSRALGYSPRPPESVYSTDTKETSHAAFLGSVGSSGYAAKSGPHHVSGMRLWFVPIGSWNQCPYRLEPAYHQPAAPTLLRPSSVRRCPWWCRNINLLPITYAFRPRLRVRLTHGRIILPQETLGLRRQSFSLC